MASPAVKNAEDAEAFASSWLRRKYPRLVKVQFHRVWKELDAWVVDGELEYRASVLRWKKKPFQLKLSALSGDVIGYA